MSTESLQHAWDVIVDEAVGIQQRLRAHVVTSDAFGPIERVAGVDIGFEDEGQTTRAAVAVLRFPELTLETYTISRRPTSFPYIPGFLSFREVPAALDALAQLDTRPDMLLVDGQGLAHPRRLGVACHLGVLANIPSIGVAKSLLIGRFAPPRDERGAWTPLVDKGEVIGAALHSRVGTKPLFISSGHRISLQSAIDLVMACTTRYRLPETTRWAHKLASDKAYR